MAVDYRDDSTLSADDRTSISRLITAIRTKMYGRDVREAIAEALEMGTKVDLTSLESQGINLLQGTKATSQTMKLSNQKDSTPQASNGDLYVPKAGQTYTYHVVINDAPANAFALVACYDENIKRIKSYTSNYVHTDFSSKFAKVTFTPDSSIKYIRFIPVSFETNQTGNITWSQEMLETGSVVHDYDEGISNSSTGETFSTLINKISDKSSLGEIKIPGFNLLSGTTNQARTWELKNTYNLHGVTTTDKPFKVMPNTTYTYHAVITNAPADAFVLVYLRDKDNKNIQAIKGTSYRGNEGHISQVTFTTTSDTVAVYLCPVAFSNAQSGAVETYSEMLELGNIMHEWVPNISEISLFKVLSQAVNQLPDYVHRDDIAVLDVPGLNLLQGTSDKEQSITVNNEYHMPQAINNNFLIPVKPHMSYIYHVKITKTPVADTFAVIETFDKDGKKIGILGGSNIQNNATGTTSLNFNTADDISFVRLYPAGFHETETGEVKWKEEMLETGPVEHDYTKHLSEMSSQEAVSELVNKLKLGQNSNMSKPWSGKSITAIGDSITYGYLRVDSDKKDITAPWTLQLEPICGFTNVTNNGVGSSRVAKAEGQSKVSMAERIDSITGQDFLAFLGGVNDYADDIPLGEFSDSEITTFYGALHHIAKMFVKNNSGAKTLWMTPVINTNLNHHTYDDKGKLVVNDAGYTELDYANAVKEVASYYGFPVLDLFNDCVVNPNARPEYFRDGTHPNEQGYVLLGQQISKYINTL